jgi:hypothetical protein
MAAFNLGDNVTVNNTNLSGVVSGAALDNTTLEVTFLVDFTVDNVNHNRYFNEDQLTKV